MKECCAVKTETVKQIHSKYELVKKDLVFSAVLGLSFTRKKVLHDEPLPKCARPRLNLSTTETKKSTQVSP